MQITESTPAFNLLTNQGAFPEAAIDKGAWFTYNSPMQHPVHTDELAPMLQPGETVLWSERRRQMMDGYITFSLIAGAVTLFLYGLLLLESFISPGGTDENMGVRVIFMVLSLCCFILAGLMVLNHRRQVYVLTQRRAVIARLSSRGVRCEHEFPVSPHMLKALVRHPDGSASFIFDTLRMSHSTALPVGFIDVQQAAELETRLRRCGAKLSAAEEYGRKSRTRPRGVNILFALLTAGIAATCFIRDMQGDTELMLTLRGEPATATIVGYHAQGSRDGERLCYPVLQFSTKEGTSVRAIDRFNEQSAATDTGEQTDILYAPHQPTVVMRSAPGRFMRPTIMLLVFCVALYMGLSGLYRLHKSTLQS